MIIGDSVGWGVGRGAGAGVCKVVYYKVNMLKVMSMWKLMTV